MVEPLWFVISFKVDYWSITDASLPIVLSAFWRE